MDKATIKISDFGLSKILSHYEKTTEGYGTLPLTAPEIIKHFPYSKSVDVWSLGIMAYFLISKALPFIDNNYVEKIIANKIKNSKLDFPNCLWKNVSKKAISFIELCLEKDEKKRWTIDEVLAHEWLKPDMEK